MPNVTERIKEIKQPKGGYINPKHFLYAKIINDNINLFEEENIHPILIGLCVDYMIRFIGGSSKEDAFSVSLGGACYLDFLRKQKISEKNAENLLKDIKGLDDKSIINACKLVGYDVCVRTGNITYYRPVEEINPDEKTIFNIRTMINRGINFLNQYGPITVAGFGVAGGCVCGDGDFLTKDTLWELKTSKYRPKSEHTLQLLMYYLMGINSKHDEFIEIKKLGIFNPRLNIVYLMNISDIPEDIINQVSKEVIGYK